MIASLHRGALAVFRRLPVRLRRRVVRTIAPSFTVGAICIIERTDGALLLVRLSYRDRWGLPGGLLKRGETTAEAARREVAEEVGVTVRLIREPQVVVDADAQRVDVIFRAVLAEGVDPTLARPMSPEILEVGWFQPDALPELQTEASGALVVAARVDADGLSSSARRPGDDAGRNTDGATS
ncbi:MAG: NUDIX domain-containing protein [Acidimicrobiia bacterium]|nr:NUDIX domain-containing protein [Acidimicrobiia bacterium]